MPESHLAVHFHDTYGRGIPNVLQSVSYGIRVVDASVGGLGGCPFAPGATGNVSTEAVIEALVNAGETVTVDQQALMQARKMLDPYLDPAPHFIPDPESLACSTCEFSNSEQCCDRKH